MFFPGAGKKRAEDYVFDLYKAQRKQHIMANIAGGRLPNKKQGGTVMTPEEFVTTFKPYAKIIEEMYGLPWRAVLAQAALETGWLRNPVTDLETGRLSYNLFNIKGEGPAGSVKAYDEQYINGRLVKRVHRFRAYHNYEESFIDYARLITENPRYQEALDVAADPEAYVRRIQKAGYAEDPRYAEKLIQIMRKYIQEEAEPID